MLDTVGMVFSIYLPRSTLISRSVRANRTNLKRFFKKFQPFNQQEDKEKTIKTPNKSLLEFHELTEKAFVLESAVRLVQIP